MRALALLTLILSFTVESKTVCTYVFGCAQCVVEVSSDPPINIKTQDLACMDRLRSLNSFPFEIPRNKTELDSTPLSSPQSERARYAATVLSTSVDRIYQSYNEQKDLEGFYEDLPSILQSRHELLIEDLIEEAKTRDERRPKEIEAFKNQVKDLLQDIGTHHSLPVSQSPIQINGMESIGLQEELSKIQMDLQEGRQHEGFPTITGHDIPKGSGRESNRNAGITDQDRRSHHLLMLNASDNFRKNNADDLANELLEGARQFRHGDDRPRPLMDRVEAFEISQSYIQDQRNLLKEKISQESSGPKKAVLEIIDAVGTELGENGRKSFYSGQLEEGEHWTGVAKQVLDIGLGFVPVVSAGKDLLEAVTGVNVVTGEKLESWERGLALVSAGTLGVGSLAKNTFRIADQLGKVLVASNKLHLNDLLDSSLIKNEVRLFNKMADRVWRNGDELNELYRLEKNIPMEKYIEPWNSRRVIEFTSTEDIYMYRIFSNMDLSIEDISKMNGRWASRINPVEFKEGKDRLKKILNLPDENLMQSYVEIKVPAGTRMRMGVVGHGKDGLRGGGIQYDLINDNLETTWIVGKPKELKL